MSVASLNPDIFRAYDIRGIVGSDLTPAIVERIGRAYATLLRRDYDARRIVVGRDNRPSSAPLRDALVEGVRAAGVSVIDIGLAPSPLLYFAAAAWGMEGGVSVTASHNPTEYNGLKLLERGGIPLSPDEIQSVRDLAERGDFLSGAGGLEQRDARGEYLDLLERRFTLARHIRVMVDPGNGVATLTGPEAMRRIGCAVSGINLDSDGTFPAHLPDPQDPRTMETLQAVVLSGDFDLGIAWDGDGDRLGVVDEHGVRYAPDDILVVFARDLLARRPGERILVDVKISLSAIEDIEAHGGEAIFGPTGHSLAKRKMRDEGIIFGGEGSAHYFFAENYYGLDDAVFASCALAQILAAQDRPLSDLFSGLKRYRLSPELKLPCEDRHKFRLAEAIAAQFRATHSVLEVDGARIIFPDEGFGGGWALVRASNTGPALSLRFEAHTTRRYEEIRATILEALRAFPEVAPPDDFGALPD